MSAAYVPAALIARRPDWLLESPLSWPAVVWIIVGLVSVEIWATHAGHWSYSEHMLTIGGIGLLPLLQ